jgi:hypothetical protein
MNAQLLREQLEDHKNSATSTGGKFRLGCLGSVGLSGDEVGKNFGRFLCSFADWKRRERRLMNRFVEGDFCWLLR